MSSRPAGAAALALLLCLSACAEDESNRLQDEDREVIGGNAGVQERVGENVTVADVELSYPEDGVYEAGEDASLSVAITNTGPDPVRLTEVTGPDFADVEVSGGGLPLELEDNLYIGVEGAPTIVLMDLGESLRTSQAIPVTFTFEKVGEATVDAIVASSGEGPGG